MSMFKKPTQKAQDQNPAAPGSKPGRAPFLSPFVDTKGLSFAITSFRQGTTKFRLCPTFGPKDKGMTLDVKVLPVNVALLKTKVARFEEPDDVDCSRTSPDPRAFPWAAVRRPARSVVPPE